MALEYLTRFLSYYIFKKSKQKHEFGVGEGQEGDGVSSLVLASELFVFLCCCKSSNETRLSFLMNCISQSLFKDISEMSGAE